MWIHQRTGRNTAISYRLGAVVLAALWFIGAGLNAFENGGWAVWVIAATVALVTGAWYWSGWSNHKDAHGEQPHRDCRYCGREIQALRAQERLANDAAELARLRAKYRA